MANIQDVVDVQNVLGDYLGAPTVESGLKQEIRDRLEQLTMQINLRLHKDGRRKHFPRELELPADLAKELENLKHWASSKLPSCKRYF